MNEGGCVASVDESTCYHTILTIPQDRFIARFCCLQVSESGFSFRQNCVMCLPESEKTSGCSERGEEDEKY